LSRQPPCRRKVQGGRPGRRRQPWPRSLLAHCIGQHIAGELDTVTASMTKYWITDIQGKIIDPCNCLAVMVTWKNTPSRTCYRDARVMRICAGTNEIMNVLIARSL